MAYETLLRALGAMEEPAHLDVGRTPHRVAKMLAREMLSSYLPGSREDLVQRFTTFPVAGSQEMVAMGPIPFTSLCAHHLMPFVGDAWVGYIPGSKLAGLSKFPRAVKFFSRKLQMQERLTTEIADFIVEMLEPQAVIVSLEARHFCMEARGIEAHGVSTRTSAVRGLAMSDAQVREEFYSLLAPRK